MPELEEELSEDEDFEPDLSPFELLEYAPFPRKTRGFAGAGLCGGAWHDVVPVEHIISRVHIVASPREWRDPHVQTVANTSPKPGPGPCARGLGSRRACAGCRYEHRHNGGSEPETFYYNHHMHERI